VLDLPAAHFKHPIPYSPPLQSAHEIEPIEEVNVPKAHGVHEVMPILSAYLPISHASHFFDLVNGATVPPTHKSHSLKPEDGAAFPAAQSVHDELPSLLFVDVPASHVRHDISFVFPGEDTYLPTPHLIHELPLVGLYLPAVHETQVTESAELSWPAAQGTHTSVVDPPEFALDFPTGQVAQSEGMFAYFPGAQNEQVTCALGSTPSSSTVFPFAQRLQVTDPGNSVYFPTEQVEQLLEPRFNENFPTAQFTHAEAEVDPKFALAFPAAQSVQGPPSPDSLYFPSMQEVQSEIEV